MEIGEWIAVSSNQHFWVFFGSSLGLGVLEPRFCHENKKKRRIECSTIVFSINIIFFYP